MVVAFAVSGDFEFEISVNRNSRRVIEGVGSALKRDVAGAEETFVRGQLARAIGRITDHRPLAVIGNGRGSRNIRTLSEGSSASVENRSAAAFTVGRNNQAAQHLD